MIDAPAAPPAGTVAPGRAAALAGRVRRRGWLLACCLLVVLLPFVTAPGRIISDTKLDLAIAPVRFLARALSLWDPQQFGQLQDQVVGYLFPMGPFFVLGHLAAVPPWVTQRLWISAVALAAFGGTVRLAGRLGIGGPRTRLIAGVAYALAPAGLTLLGTDSAQYLPAAMLPWILLPLAQARPRGFPPRTRLARPARLARRLAGLARPAQRPARALWRRLEAQWEGPRLPPPGPRRDQLWRTSVRVAGQASATVVLAAAGLWLGGYPGVIILPLATWIFRGAAPGAPAGPRAGRGTGRWRWVAQPWLLTALLLAAAVGSAVGGHLLLTGDVSTLVTGLADAAPQVIGLIVVARLATALIERDKAPKTNSPPIAGPVTGK